MIKLKIYKTSIKKYRTKIKIIKIEVEIQTTKRAMCHFQGKRKKKVHRRQTKQSPPTHAVTPKRRHGGASNDTIEGCF